MPGRLEIPSLASSPAAPELYPVGWSRDGKLALAMAGPWSDGFGGLEVTVGIYDLRTDRYLWSRSESIECEEGKDIVALFWHRQARAMAAQMRRHRIVSILTPLRTFPYVLDGDTVDIAVQVERLRAEESDWCLPFIKSAAVWVVSSGLGTKTLFRLAARDSGHIGLLSVAVAGFLESPFERRIAVLLVHTHMGWEGPPNTESLSIIGCSLVDSLRWSKQAAKAP